VPTSNQGFTLLEIVIVVALISFMTALAAPRFIAYQQRQDARTMIQRVSGVISNARAEAIRRGNNQFVLLDFPANGVARVVDDTNNDWAVSVGETTRDVSLVSGLSNEISRWSVVPGPPPSSPVPEDGALMPSGGTSFPVDAATAAPGVGFTPRGFPVSLPAMVGGPSGPLGSGAGTYYVTDNDTLVYAATLLPLGGTRVRGYRPVTDDWY
jgi:prepilin-type N-terminal cleavage/methylation domain-containing protein